MTLIECPVPLPVIREEAPCIGLRELIGILHSRETAGGERRIPNVDWVRDCRWRIAQDGMPFRVPFEDVCVFVGVHVQARVLCENPFYLFPDSKDNCHLLTGNYFLLNAHVVAWQVAHIEAT